MVFGISFITAKNYINKNDDLMKKIILILVLLIFINCKKTEIENSEYNSPEKEKKIINDYLKNPANKRKLEPFKSADGDFENLKKEALKGNITCYALLIIHYTRSENQVNFFDLQPISKIMADKYNHGDAHNQIYQDIVKFNNKNKKFEEKLFLNLDDRSKKEALHYLNKGVTLKDDECIIILAKNYKHGYGVLKNAKKADSLIRSLNWHKALTDDELKKL